MNGSPRVGISLEDPVKHSTGSNVSQQGELGWNTYVCAYSSNYYKLTQDKWR